MTTPPAPHGLSHHFHWRPVTAIAAIVFITHIVVNLTSPYGVHRDEFLYLAMGEHLRILGMDFPPMIAILARVERALFGDALLAIRLFPAITAAGTILLAGAIAREFGGGRFAQVTAALVVAAHPLFLRPGNLFQPVVFDQFWWTLALFSLARLRRTADERWWIALGVAGGLGLLTKFSMLILGFGLLVALLLVWRESLKTRGPWLALGIALAIGSPSLIGQLALGFPLAAQMRALQAQQLSHVTYWSFLGWQLLLGPSVLLALAGLIALLRPPLREFRVVGVACAAAFAAVFLLRGKGYYVGPVYPTLFAAGAVWLARLGAGAGAMLFQTAVLTAMLLFDAVILPIGLPVLPKERMARYAAAVGIAEATRTNQGRQLRLPQDYADMLGWPERAAMVAHVYDSLPPEKRAQAVIVGENYGEAGALDFYGPKLGLPHAVSAAGSYWFFGPGEKPGAVLVTLGVSREDLLRFYGVVTPAAHLTNDWTVEEEQDLTVYVAEQPKMTIQELWPKLAGRN